MREEVPPGSMPLGDEVSGLGLRAFRVALGLLMAFAMARYFWTGRIERQFVEPTFFFTYLGFDWVQPLPSLAMHGLLAVLSALGLLLASGVAHRWAAGGLFVGFTYLHLIDKTTYLNHYYLLGLLLFIVWTLPLGRGGPSQVPRRVLFWVRFQVGIVYVMAAIAKWHTDWLVDGEPLRTWLLHRQGALGLPDFLVSDQAAVVMSWAGMLFDLLIVPLLCLRRTRAWAFAMAVLFHLLTAVLFPIGVFPFAMIVAITIFLPADWPARFAGGRWGRWLLAGDEEPARRRAWFDTRLGRGFIVAWCLVQTLIPLRHHLYPGDDHWTEEAFRFSWKVMLIEKYGAATFTVVDPKTGERREIDPAEELTPIQVRMMAHQADMLLQYAHHLRDDHEARTGRVPEVYVRARVKWNGRPSELYLDPKVDLARECRGFDAKPWILPAPQ